MAHSLENSTLPALPVCLRVGVAGTRNLVSCYPDLFQRIHEVVASIEKAFLEVREEAKGFFTADTPGVLRFISGMAAGADIEVCGSFYDGPNWDKRELIRQVAGIYPATAHQVKKDHLDSTEALHLFERIRKLCAFELELRCELPDSRHDLSVHEQEVIKEKRARAFRSQAYFLLKNCDLLLAVVDPEKPGSAGGTLETIHAATSFGIPVILINSATGRVSDLEPFAIYPTKADEALDYASIIRLILLPSPKARDVSKEWIKDFRLTLYGRKRPHLDRLERLAEWVWRKLSVTLFLPKKLRRVQKGTKPAPTPSAARAPRPSKLHLLPIESLSALRDNLAKASRNYNSLYRGAFTLVYTLAAFAVLLAAGCAFLLGAFRAESFGIQIALLILAGAKFLALLTMNRLVQRSHHHDWNKHAVERRYLAERIRQTLLLSECHEYKALTIDAPHTSSRARYYNHLDWWLSAVARSIEVTGHLHFDKAKAKFEVRSWINDQIRYHYRTHEIMRHMARFFDKTSKFCSVLAMVAVGADIIFAVLYLLPEVFHFKALMPTLAPEYMAASLFVFIATFAPAIVASANAIRSQSECDRLSERSKETRSALKSAKRSLKAADDPLEITRVAEGLSALSAHEISSWSALYAKSLFEV